MVTRIKPKEQKVLQQAQALLSQNDANAAKSILIDYSRKNKPSEPTKYVLSLCHAVLGEFKKALGPMPALCKSHPENIEYHKLTGSIYHGLQDYDSAIRYFKKALSINSRDVQTLSNIASSLQEAHQFDEAETYYKQSFAIQPNQPDALTNYGLMLQANAKLDESIASHTKALQIAPDHITAWYNLAFALSEKGDYENSLKLYERVITAAPNHVRALCDTAYILSELKQPEKALRYLYTAVELEPDNEHALLNLAKTHKKLNNIEQAEICYNKVISKNPDNEIARYYLAMIKGENSFACSPVNYVQELFDGYAETFDNELVNKLKYYVPEQIGGIVKKHSAPSQKYKILDLGCGTGLVGTHLKEISEQMTGVDIAPKMIKKTAQKGIYDKLVTSGIETYFETHDYRPNLVTSADVFIYIGDISHIFTNVSKSLEDGGLFVFSIEGTDEDDHFMLKDSGRFGHNEKYIKALTDANNFTIVDIEKIIVRFEAGEPIHGHIYLLKK